MTIFPDKLFPSIAPLPGSLLFIILVRKSVNDSVYIEIDIEKAKKIRENDEENNRFPKILRRFIHMKIEDFAKSRQ